MTDQELAEWKDHGMFNAWRYGLLKFEDTVPTMPTREEVKAFLEWAELWESMGVPG